MSDSLLPMKKNAPQAGNRVDQICSLLTKIAKERGPRARLPSIKNLCESLGTSTSTLDRALSELERRDIIEREHGRGIFVSNSLRSKTIGILMEVNPVLPRTSPYYAMIVEQAEVWAARRHYGVLPYLNLSHNHGLESVRQRLIRDVQDQRVDGVLVAGAANFDQIDWLQKNNVPCVYRGVDYEAGYHVDLDVTSVVHSGVESLVRRGCRRIGLIGHDGDRFDRHVSRKRQAILQALEAADLTYQEAYGKLHRLTWQQSVSPDAPTHEEMGRDAMLEIWQRFEDQPASSRPDGLIVTDDLLARGVLAGMHQLGLLPGRDIHIAATTNRGSPVLACYLHQLIQIEFDVSQIASTMLEMLGQLIAGKTPPQQHIKLRPVVQEPLVAT